jgi:hypothetical protein
MAHFMPEPPQILLYGIIFIQIGKPVPKFTNLLGSSGILNVTLE